LSLICIPLLSINGRALQGYISSNYSSRQLAFLLGSILVLLSLKAVLLQIKNHGVNRLWHLLWFLPLFIVLPYYMPIIEERLHFIVFGLYGYLSMLVLPRFAAYIACLLLGIGDELLQWVLPDRVGDWRDVQFNLLAAFAATLFAQLSLKNVHE
jgi:VanZ family protein